MDENRKDSDRIKFCRYCDGVIEWGTKHCPHCGEALEVVSFDDMEFIAVDRKVDRGRGLRGTPPPPAGASPPAGGPPVVKPTEPAPPPTLRPIGSGPVDGPPVLTPIPAEPEAAPPVMKPIGPPRGKRSPVMKPIGPARGKGPPVVQPIAPAPGEAPPVIQPIAPAPGKAPPVIQPIAPAPGKGPPVVKPIGPARGKGPPVVKPIGPASNRPPVVQPIPAEGPLPGGVEDVEDCPVCGAEMDDPDAIGGTCTACGQAVCLACLMKANGARISASSVRNRERWEEQLARSRGAKVRCPACGRPAMG